MKYTNTVVPFALIVLLVVAGVFYFVFRSSGSQCSEQDYQTNSCIPAGSCHSDPAVDAVTDCDVKDYDRPLVP